MARQWRPLVLCSLAIAIGLSVPAAGRQGFAIRFEGVLRVGRTIAPAGTAVSVITAHDLNDTYVCGRFSVGSGGLFRVDIPTSARCLDEGNGGGPVAFLFVWEGQKVGGHNAHLSLQRPETLGRTVTVALAGALTGTPPTAPPLLVPMRFYGTFRIGGRPAPPGTKISLFNVPRFNSADDLAPCGETSVTSAGAFVLDVANSDACADVLGSAVQFYFTFDSMRIGLQSTHIRHDVPQTLGRAVQVSLTAPVIPGLQPAFLPLVPIRFYGTFRLNGQPAPPGTPVEVRARPSPNDISCGDGIVTEPGFFYADIYPRAACRDEGNAGGPVVFSFTSDGVRVGGASVHVSLDRPGTLGRAIKISLSGKRR